MNEVGIQHLRLRHISATFRGERSLNVAHPPEERPDALAFQRGKKSAQPSRKNGGVVEHRICYQDLGSLSADASIYSPL
jgi:hypothetical protein